MFSRFITQRPFTQVPKRTFSSSVVVKDRVTVIGGGLMGSGIVQTSAQAGHKVTLVDMNEEVLKKSIGAINKVSVKVNGHFPDFPRAWPESLRRSILTRLLKRRSSLTELWDTSLYVILCAILFLWFLTFLFTDDY